MTSNMKYQSLIFLFFVQAIILPGFEALGTEKSRSHYMNVRTAEELRKIFRYTGDSVCFLSSHRGGPEKNLPENCIATFENTLKYSYSVMEIDPRYTKDSVMIVHHDPTLQRTTNGKGKVADFTLKELKKLKLKDTEGNVTKYGIPTFEEVLKWAKGKTILILDKKDVPIEDRIKMVEKYNAEAYTIVMAYSFEEAKLCYSLNKNIMMQVFLPTPEKVMEFDKTGVPWDNIVAFINHKKPVDSTIFDMIHQKGALCIQGTSRNYDREFIEGRVTVIDDLKKDYNSLYRLGADILETDIPVPVSKVVENRLSSATYISKIQK